MCRDADPIVKDGPRAADSGPSSPRPTGLTAIAVQFNVYPFIYTYTATLLLGRLEPARQGGAEAGMRGRDGGDGVSRVVACPAYRP